MLPILHIRSDPHRFRILLFVLASVQSILCSGIIFGYPALLLTLQDAGVYSDRCKPGDAPMCDQRSLDFELIFTCGSSLNFFSIVIFGPFLDWKGPRATNILASITTIAGILLFAAGSASLDSYPFAFALIGLGGYSCHVSLFSVSNLFGNKKATALSAFPGFLMLSSFVYVLFNALYTVSSGSISIRSLFIVHAFILACVSAVMAIVWPDSPFPLMFSSASSTPMIPVIDESNPKQVDEMKTQSNASEDSSPLEIVGGENQVSDNDDNDVDHIGNGVFVNSPSISDFREAIKLTGRLDSQENLLELENDNANQPASNVGNESEMKRMQSKLTRISRSSIASTSIPSSIAGAEQDHPLDAESPPTSPPITTSSLSDASQSKSEKQRQNDDITFRKAVSTPVFSFVAITFILLLLRLTLFVGSIKLQLEIMGDAKHTYLHIFTITASLGFTFVPLFGYFLDNHGIWFSLVLVMVLHLFIYIFLSIPYLPLQMLTFIIYAFSRPFLFACFNSFLSSRFGFRMFGKLSSLIAVFTSTTSLLQYPLVNVAISEFGGNFLPVNLFMLVAPLPLVFFFKILRTDEELFFGKKWTTEKLKGRMWNALIGMRQLIYSTKFTPRNEPNLSHVRLEEELEGDQIQNPTLV